MAMQKISIHKACMNGDVQLVEQLINQDPSLISFENVNDQTVYGTPLHCACSRFQLGVVRLLLNRGALVNIRAHDQATPLSELLNAAASWTISNLEWEKSFEILEVLLEAGANPNAVDGEGRAVWHYHVSDTPANDKLLRLLFKYGMDANMKSMGETMSRIRCWSNDGELLELFIDNWANVNEIDERKGTLLHSIFNAYSKFGDENVHEMVMMLFRKGFTEINYAIGPEQTTALCNAAFYDNLDSVRYLLNHGARVDLGQPLDFLSRGFDRVNTVWVSYVISKLLIEHGATLDPLYNDGLKAVQSLINPGEQEVKKEAARDILKLIVEENALRIPEKMPTRLRLGLKNQNILQCANIKRAGYLYQLGYTVKEIDCLSNEVKPGYAFNSVLSLQSLCRINVRKTLATPCSALVEQLLLPKPLKDFLCMKYPPENFD